MEGGESVVYTTAVIDESKLRREARKRVRAPAVQALISKRPVRIPKRVGRPPKALKAQREAEAAAAAAAAANAAKSRKRSTPSTANGDRRGDGSKQAKSSANGAPAAAAAAPASASCPASKRIKSATATTGSEVAVTSSSSSAGAAASPSNVHVASQTTMDSRDSQDRRQRCCGLTGHCNSDGESKSDGAGANIEFRSTGSVAHERHCCVVGGAAKKIESGKSACAGHMLCCGVGSSSSVHDRRAEAVDVPTQSQSTYCPMERGGLENGVVSACPRATSSSSCLCCSGCCCRSHSCCTSACPHSVSSSSSSLPSCSPSPPPQSVSSYLPPLPRFDSVGSSECSEKFAAYSPDSIFGFASQTQTQTRTQKHSRTVCPFDQGGFFPQPFAFDCADSNTTANAWSSEFAPCSSARLVETPPPPPTTTLSSWPIGLPAATSTNLNCSNYAIRGTNVTNSYEAGRLMTLPSMKCEDEHLLSTQSLEQRQRQQQEEVKCSAATGNHQPAKSSSVTGCDPFFAPRLIPRIGFGADRPGDDIDIQFGGMSRRSGVCVEDYGGSLCRLDVDGSVKKGSQNESSNDKLWNVIEKSNVRTSSSAIKFVKGRDGRSEPVPVRRFGAPLDLLEQHQQRLHNLERGGVCEPEKWKSDADETTASKLNVVALAAKAKMAVDSSDEASDGSAESTMTGTTSVDTTLARRRSSSVEVTTETIQRIVHGDSAMEDIDEYMCTASGPAPMPEPVSSASMDGDPVVLLTPHNEESWPSNLELESEWILSCHVEGGEANKLTSAIGSLTNEGGRPLLIRSSRDEDSAFTCEGRQCLTFEGDDERVVQAVGCHAQATCISFTAAETGLGELSHVSESCGLYDSQGMVCVFGGEDGSTFCSGVTDQNIDSLLLPEDIGEILDELELPSLQVPDSQFTGLGSQPSALKDEDEDDDEEECPLENTELLSSALSPTETIGMMREDGLLSYWMDDDPAGGYCLTVQGGSDLYTLDDIF